MSVATGSKFYGRAAGPLVTVLVLGYVFMEMLIIYVIGLTPAVLFGAFIWFFLVFAAYRRRYEKMHGTKSAPNLDQLYRDPGEAFSQMFSTVSLNFTMLRERQSNPEMERTRRRLVRGGLALVVLTILSPLLIYAMLLLSTVVRSNVG